MTTRDLLIGGGAILAAVVIALLFFWPGIIYDPFDDGNKAQATAQQTPGVLDAGIQNPFANGSAGACRAIQDYQLEDLPEVATSGSHIRVQYWNDGTPGEKETFLPAREADGGRFILTKPLKGHVWEFANCTDAQMRSDADASTQRRLNGHADNRGFVEWCTAGLFQPSQASSAPTTCGSTSDTAAPQVSQPDRTDCNEIRGGAYRSDTERAWFLANCQSAQVQQPVSEPAASPLNCDTATAQETHVPVVGLGWTPAGEWRVVNFWTNEPGQDQAEHKILLSPGDNTPLMGGGTSWSWPASCEQAARDAFSGN